MKRAAVTIMVCLLLGAIINVAVAWGVVLWTPAFYFAESEAGPWIVRVPGDWPPATERLAQRDVGLATFRQAGSTHNSMRAEVNGEYQAAKAHAQAIDDPTERAAAMSNAWKERERTIWSAPYRIVRIDLLRSGWPVLSLTWESRRCETHSYAVEFLSVNTTGSKPGISIPTWIPRGTRGLRDHRYLPIHPLPLGFAVNTVAYASCLWLLYVLPRHLRMWLRHRRGCCTACGYDLRGAAHERCPECGTATASELRHSDRCAAPRTAGL